jgi:hypothetical protein
VVNTYEVTHCAIHCLHTCFNSFRLYCRDSSRTALPISGLYHWTMCITLPMPFISVVWLGWETSSPSLGGSRIVPGSAGVNGFFLSSGKSNSSWKLCIKIGCRNLNVVLCCTVFHSQYIFSFLIWPLCLSVRQINRHLSRKGKLPSLALYGGSTNRDQLHPPKVDRFDVAGGLTPGLSEPGNKESTGNLTV